jgi:phage terminase small subunit
MAQRGRKSAAAMSVAIVGSDLSKFPEPSAYLSPEQDAVWRDVIASRGGDLIAPESYPVLIEFCRAVDSSNKVASQLDAFSPEWATDEEGLKRWDKLLSMQDRLSRNVASLAAKLRLTPSSRVQAISAGRNADKGVKVKPWEMSDA